MILIQIASFIETTTPNSTGSDFIFYLEIVILVGIAIIQLYRTLKAYNNIKDLKNIFNNQLFIKNAFIEKVKLGNIEADSDEIQYDSSSEESLDEIVGEDIIKLPLVDTHGKSEIINKIKNAVNNYLINNYGAAVNFSIIKDIIDREVDIKDEEISQSVTVPLYLGLVATMIGIILGLWSMPDLSANSGELFNNLSSIAQNHGNDGFNSGINALIRGVQWAMGASLLGLLCTTLLSTYFYKNAKRKTLTEKNDQLSYLQAKLLPELIKAEDTGVSGLKASLDRFARVATNISDNVLIASNQTGENLVLQQEVIDKIENMKVLKVSKWNLEMFDKLDKNMEIFSKFSSYLSKMEKIASNLHQFSERTSNIDHVINQIGSTLNESKQLTQFLASHFDKIEASGSAALKSVGLAETHFENAIESLKTRTDEMINQLYASAGNHEIKLEDIYEEIEKSLSGITSKYISEFSNAYSDSVPKFEQLENLSLLADIKFETHAKNELLIENIKELNDSVKSLKGNINSQSIVNTLSSIDENLRRKQVRKPKANHPQIELDLSETKNEPPILPVLEKKAVGLGGVLKKLLKR